MLNMLSVHTTKQCKTITFSLRYIPTHGAMDEVDVCKFVYQGHLILQVVDKKKRAGPWEPIVPPHIEIQKQPCPPCQVSFIVSR